MEFRILGPLEVVADGRRIEVSAPKQRLLLTVLALAGGRVVSADRLMDELWAERPPSGGLKTLRYHVSKLRDTLQPDRAPGHEGVVVTRPPGYALVVPPDDIDAHRFERQAREARRLIEFDPGDAAVRLREALELWRGPLPGELLEAPAAGLEARRLEELRLAALEDRIGADLAAGHHAEVVAELESLVVEHPLRERLWAQLMVALYRCDRQAEALRTYQELRRRLGEELGIEPSPDLRRLEESILLQDPDLDVPEGLQRPSSLRGYESRERIGEGAFGLVWRASQRSVDREVAVKVVRPEQSNRPGSVLGFQAQAQLLALLDHPHIVPVYDFWRDPDGAYLVMPLMSGGSLGDLDTGGWESSRVVGLVEQIGSGLAHAHRLGLAHADLHPGNILLDGDGNAYLADFGLAANLSGGSSTPPEAFSSPEQLRGEPGDPASDVYGLGKLVYRAFAGIDPGPGPLPPLGAHRAELPAAVDDVLRRATDPDPTARHADAEEFLEDFRRALGEMPAPVADVRNPYKGLRAFGEADAADFFGRDDLVDELAETVARHRIAVVVGPSGSGKSSLVRAGLVPALRSGRIAGSEQWLVAALYPGPDPFAALAEALRSVAVRPVPDATDPAWDPGRAAATARGLLPAEADLVLVVDQFEELFTLGPAEDDRRRFMDVLLELARDAHIRIVTTVRADYYGLPLEYRPLGDAVREATVAVTPPGLEQLTQAIVRPAAAVGVAVEPELAAELAADVTEAPGGLPLMQYALTRLFEERSNGRVGIGAYRDMGGLDEILGSWPERLYGDLDEAGREACRQIFLRLVTVDESGQPTRRRAPLPEFLDLGVDGAAVDRVLAAFSDARLLTFDRDPATRTPTVEVAHEALLEQWRRAHGWIGERRESLIMRRRLEAAATEWERAERGGDYLLTGSRLDQFESWAAKTDTALSEGERRFLEASRRRQAVAAATRRRRRRFVGAVLGALAAAAVVFGVVALIQGNRASDQKEAAEEQAALAAEQAAVAVEQAALAEAQTANAEAQERIARAKGLAGASAAQIDRDQELAVLLAIEAVETTLEADGFVLREAEEALHAALAADRLISTATAEMWAYSVEWEPHGGGYYLAGRTVLQKIDAATGRADGEFLLYENPDGMKESNIHALRIVGADDEWLAVARYSPSDIWVLDRATLEEVFRFEGAPWSSIMDLDVSADGLTLAGINPIAGALYVWDLETRTKLGSFTLDCGEAGDVSDPGCPRGVALSPDGNLVTSGRTVWDVASGDVLLSGLVTGDIFDVEMLDDRRMIVSDDSVARVIDLGTGETLQTLEGQGGRLFSIDVAADGVLVAAGSDDGRAMVWNLAKSTSSPVLTLAAQQGTVWEVRFSPDGRYLTTTAGRYQFPPDLVYDWPRTWEARTWDVSPSGPGEVLARPTRESGVGFGPDGLIAVADPLRGAGIWDVESQSRVVTLSGWAETSEVTAAAFSGDGSALVLGGVTQPEGAAYRSGWVAVFDPATGAMIRELVRPLPGVVPNEVAYSPDGSALVVAAAGGLARVWDTTTWEVTFRAPDLGVVLRRDYPVTDYVAAAFHPDGTRLYLQHRNPDPAWSFTISVWDLETDSQPPGAALDHSPRGGRGAIVPSPDGRMVVTAGAARPEVVETFSSRWLARLDGASSFASEAAFSPDGTRIATGEADGTVRLWDAATAEETLVLEGHQALVVDVAFNPEGTMLASVGLDGTMRVWTLEIDDLLALARSRVSRELTDIECRLYVGVDCAPAPGPERLIPAAMEAAGPYGVDEEAWEGAPEGGTWSEVAFEMPGGFSGGAISTVLDPHNRALLAFNTPEWGDSPMDPYQAESWSLDLESGEIGKVADLPGVPDPLLPPGAEPWPATPGPLVYHEELDLVVTTRVDDGATFAYTPEADEWSELVPAMEPLARYGYGWAHDAESDLVVLFGGARWLNTSQGGHAGLGDTWVLDVATATWTEVTPELSPPPRRFPNMVYDAPTDRIVLFGGNDRLGGGVLGDTWVYDANTNTWTEMSPAVSPPARYWSAVWYDPAADTTFLFGGDGDGTSWPGLPWKQLGAEELWGYDVDTNVWTLFRADPNPGYRSPAGAVFDPVTGTALVYGGNIYDEDRRFRGVAADLWTYRHDGG